MKSVDLLQPVRKTRNSVMHTPDMKVSNVKFLIGTQTMLDLLSDPKLLSGLPSAKHAAAEIQKVRQADFQISLEDESVVIEDLITALKKATNDTKTEATELRNEFNSMQLAGEQEKKNLQRQIQQQEEGNKKILEAYAFLKYL